MSRYDLLISNARVFTADPENPYIDSAAIVIHQGQILWLGNSSELPEQYLTGFEQQLDSPSGWLTPGFIDCHTHLVYGGNRADEFRRQLEGESYQSIAESGGGIISTVNATRAADPDTLFEQSSKRLQAWLTQGVTHIEIKSGYGLNLEAEKTMLRIATQLADSYPIGVSRTLLAAHALPPEFDNYDAYLDHIVQVILPECIQENLVDAVDGFCENIAFNTAQIQRLFEAATEAGVPLKLHAEQLSNQGGSQLAASMGALSVDHLSLIHI